MSHWSLKTPMTLTLGFQGQFLKQSYLSNRCYVKISFQHNNHVFIMFCACRGIDHVIREPHCAKRVWFIVYFIAFIGEPGREKEGGGKTTRQKTAQTVAHSAKTAQTVANTAQQLANQTPVEDSPKREQRKRTRGSITPSTAENTPTSTKRQRRI